jgi:hypothetical protein
MSWTFAQSPRELRGGFAPAKLVGAASLALAPAQSARCLGRREKGVPFLLGATRLCCAEAGVPRKGVQIDASEIAREAGLKFPVYLTRAVWENYVRVPDGVRCQDEKGRLWGIVSMLRCAARRTSGPQMLFGLHVRNDNRDRTPPLVNLKAVCGPRDIDDPSAAITVMLPDED